MSRFFSTLVLFCVLFVAVLTREHIPALLSGVIFACGMRPLLFRFPFNKIESFEWRKKIMVAVLVVIGISLTTYVVVSSARGIVENVGQARKERAAADKKAEEQKQEELRTIDSLSSSSSSISSETASAVGLVETVSVQETKSKSFASRIESLLKFVPGMNAEEITRLWREVVSKIRDFAFSFLSKILILGPGVLLQWVLFIISFVLIFINFENLMASVKALDSRFKGIKKSAEIFEEATQSTLLGTLIAGFTQASLITVGIAIAGFDSFILFGVCAFFASFVPFFGTGIVWGSALIYSLVMKQTDAAIIVGVTGAISSVADNIVFPTFVGSTNKVHPLLLFIIIIGAMEFFGIWGLFIGPVLAIFTVRVSELWLAQNTKGSAAT